MCFLENWKTKWASGLLPHVYWPAEGEVHYYNATWEVSSFHNPLTILIADILHHFISIFHKFSPIIYLLGLPCILGPFLAGPILCGFQKGSVLPRPFGFAPPPGLPPPPGRVGGREALPPPAFFWLRGDMLAGWWQLKYFGIFTPKIGLDEAILTNILFQGGWNPPSWSKPWKFETFFQVQELDFFKKHGRWLDELVFF